VWGGSPTKRGAEGEAPAYFSPSPLGRGQSSGDPSTQEKTALLSRKRRLGFMDGSDGKAANGTDREDDDRCQSNQKKIGEYIVYHSKTVYFFEFFHENTLPSCQVFAAIKYCVNCRNPIREHFMN
jgi:hypothetical protein